MSLQLIFKPPLATTLRLHYRPHESYIRLSLSFSPLSSLFLSLHDPSSYGSGNQSAVSSPIGLMEEPETNIRAKPKSRAKLGDRADKRSGRGSVKPQKFFENFNLKLYNLAIVEAKINNYQ